MRAAIAHTVPALATALCARFSLPRACTVCGVQVGKAAQGMQEEEQAKAMQKDMPVFLEGAWFVSLVDVESTLRKICKKVLTDTSLGKDARKRRAATAMNDRSTRAHTLLLLRFRQRRAHMVEPRTSLLVLADLGGSEKLTKSRANAELRTVGAVDAGEDEEARENARTRARADERARAIPRERFSLLGGVFFSPRRSNARARAFSPRRRSAARRGPSTTRAASASPRRTTSTRACSRSKA